MSDTQAADTVLSVQSGRRAPIRWLPAFFRFLAVGLGGLHAWTAAIQQSMSEDGISYLDMGDAYLRGDWGMAINTVWSPFYAWILGVTMKVLRPSMAWEFPVVHLVNFGIYLFALISFEFFWRQLTSVSRQTSSPGKENSEEARFPTWAWVSLGYTLFIWSSLNLIKIWAVTPDMLTAALVYLAGGLLLQIGTARASWGIYVAFGLILGLAYLAKAAMFPLAFVFLTVGLFVVRKFRHAAPRMLCAFLAFLLIAIPFVSILSMSKGRLTFGDAGRLTYLRYGNGVPYPHWRSGGVSGVGTPEHPPRQIFADPAVFEFTSPVGGTYPLSYDPSYWYEGVVPHLDLRKQMTVLIASAQFYFELFIRQQGGVTATVLLLFFMALGQLSRPGAFDGGWGLVVVAVVAFGMYALVYAEGRYIAAFVVLFWAGLLSLIRLPDAQLSQRLLQVGGASLLFFVCVNIATFNLEGLSTILGVDSRPREMASQPEAPRYAPLQFAETVVEMGIRPGDEIAFMGYSFGAFFARLARLRIIADIPDAEAERFWRADPSTQSAVIDAIAGTGAKAIIAEWVSPGASLDGWERVGHSRHFLYRLR